MTGGEGPVFGGVERHGRGVGQHQASGRCQSQEDLVHGGEQRLRVGRATAADVINDGGPDGGVPVAGGEGLLHVMGASQRHVAGTGDGWG